MEESLTLAFFILSLGFLAQDIS